MKVMSQTTPVAFQVRSLPTAKLVACDQVNLEKRRHDTRVGGKRTTEHTETLFDLGG